MAEMKFSDLDFLKIKENLKTFLRSQKKFEDYNFDGSGMSVLLDVLAYNTAYNGFYLNMLASEMFLDSAALRESVVSRAKSLGYIPSSRRGLTAELSIQFDFNTTGLDDPGMGFLIEKTDGFYCSVGNTRYVFYPKETAFVEPIGNKKYLARKVVLIEGKRLTYEWVVDKKTGTQQKFIIPNTGVDLATLVVNIRPTRTSTSKTQFFQFKDITSLAPTDPIYFIQEVSGEKYEIIFGDGVLGKELQDGNVIEIEYVVPTNNSAAGASKFYSLNPAIGRTPNTQYRNGINKIDIKAISKITTLIAPQDYSERETIESIKFKAPRMYDAQNRAVTKSDYEILLGKDIETIEPKIQYLRVWGGEENSPPEYGKVFCAIKPENGLSLNTAEKLRILEKYIKPKNMISTQVEIVEPEYVGLVVNTTVNYFSNKTTRQGDEIRQLALGKIIGFRDANLNGFDKDLRRSKLIKEIDAADPSIESNVTKITMKYRINPTLARRYSTTIRLFNAIDRGDVANYSRAIRSTPFYYANNLVVLSDDGKGSLGVYRANVSGANSPLLTVGSVNYETGELKITNLIVDSIPNDVNFINIFLDPANDDIIALRSQILLLENSDINVSVVDLTRVKLS